MDKQLLPAHDDQQRQTFTRRVFMVIDPVCGMSVDEKSPDILQFSSQYGGQTFNFCSQKCKDAFEQTPETYARRSA